jgi:proteasome accessory factor C
VSRTDAPPQLARVLAMIPWLATQGTVAKTEAAERFGVSLDQLEADLTLIMMIGVPPYSPGDYINISYEGDTIDVWLAPYFTRPLQLSAAEGLALLAGGRTLLAVDGSDPDGPLATALAKLEAALGVGEVTVDLAPPPLLDAVRTAAERGTTVEVDYWSAGRDEHTTRRLDPGPPFFALGEWYTDAYCHLRQEQRMFRVDRIHAVRPTDARFEPVAASGPGTIYHPRPDDPRVTVELPRGASWVAETAPCESVEDLPGGRQRVVLAVSEPSWLERILLQVGPDARVLDPPEWRDRGRDVARRVLTRYRGA